jgi:SPP1 family predicted phage head-tail adaptor
MNEFPHTITFQSYTEVSDGGGGYTEEWSDFLTTEAHVQPVSSREYVRAQALQNPIDHNVYYPYQDGVTASMRILWDGKTLDIQSSPMDQGGMGEILLVKAQLK